MSSNENMIKRGKATLEVVGGAVQEGVGHLIGNKQMEAEGLALQIVGHGHGEAAKASERVEAAVEEVVGAVKRKASELAGTVDELTRKARRATNK